MVFLFLVPISYIAHLKSKLWLFQVDVKIIMTCHIRNWPISTYRMVFTVPPYFQYQNEKRVVEIVNERKLLVGLEEQLKKNTLYEFKIYNIKECLQKSWQPQRSLVLHDWPKQTMGRLRRPEMLTWIWMINDSQTWFNISFSQICRGIAHSNE